MSAQRPLAVIALAAMTVAGLTRAQPTAAPPVQRRPPSFPGSIEQVVVDVVVTDSRGQAVTDLGPADFALTEDGARREIRAFEGVTAGARVFAIVFDDIHLTAPAGQRAQAALRDLVSNGLRDSDDVVLLRTSNGQGWSGRVGSDRASLLAALEKLRGLGLQPRSCEMSDEEALQIASLRNPSVQSAVYERFVECGILLREPARLLGPSPAGGGRDGGTAVPALGRPGLGLVETWAEEQHQRSRARTRSTCVALERLLGALAPLDGRKSVILASEGFARDRGPAELEGVARAASQVHASVYFLDARALTPRALARTADNPLSPDRAQAERQYEGQLLAAEAAELLADQTGGAAIRGHDPAQGLLRMADESRSYYLLGFAPADPIADGKFHALHVEVKRPGLTARARRGYFAVPRAITEASGLPALTAGTSPVPPPESPVAASPYGRDPAGAREQVAGWSKEQAQRAVAGLKASQATDAEIEAAALAHAAAALAAPDPVEHQTRAAQGAAALVRDPVRRGALERRVLLGLAHGFLDARQWQVAQQLAQEAVWRLPDEAEALLALGIVQETTGSVVDAGRRPLSDQSRLTAGYDELVARNPVTGFASGAPGGPGRAPDTQRRLSEARGPTAETRLRNAAESYRLALKARPDLAEARLRLGRALALVGEPKPAAKELEEVAGGTDPALAYLARLFQGDLKEQQDDLAGAAAEYRAALLVRPGAPVARLALARVEEARGERAAAQAEIEALLLEPPEGGVDDPWWAYRLRPLGRWAEALPEAR